MQYLINYTEEELETVLIKKLMECYGFKKIIRQYKIPNGRIDLLAYAGVGTYYVIEIKTNLITPDTVCQVLRYTQYLNSEKAKGGKRRFIPLIIGKDLEPNNNNIKYLLKPFLGYTHNSFYVLYDLYELHLSGVELGYSDLNNSNYINSTYILEDSYIENLEVKIDEGKYEIDCLKSQLESTSGE